MSNGLAVQATNALEAGVMEALIVGGDLSKLSPAQRLQFYTARCQSLGLDPISQPFQYLKLQNGLQLYATKSCTEQLRKIHGVSVQSLQISETRDCYIVTANVKDASGRSDSATGAVNTARLTGDALANAMMKAETKAKRRATLSICGLGMLDESEIETIPNAKVVTETEAHKPNGNGKPAATYDEWLTATAAVAGTDTAGLEAALFDWCVQERLTTHDLPAEHVHECLATIFQGHREKFREVARRLRGQGATA